MFFEFDNVQATCATKSKRLSLIHCREARRNNDEFQNTIKYFQSRERKSQSQYKNRFQSSAGIHVAQVQFETSGSLLVSLAWNIIRFEMFSVSSYLEKTYDSEGSHGGSDHMKASPSPGDMLNASAAQRF